MARAAQPGLFDLPAPAGPEGFRLTEGLINPGEEQRLLGHLADLDFKPFDFHGYQGRREVVSFGWRYDYERREIRAVEPIPAFLAGLRDAVGAFAGHAPEAFEQVLINRYAPGAGIGWHRDKPQFDEVVGVSLAGPGRLRFRRRKGEGWERMAIELQPRSAYLLSGPARREWEHSLPEVEALRYSITLRTRTAPA